MNKHAEERIALAESQNDPELLALVKKMQKHLVFLEKKIDLLIEGGSGRENRSGRPPFKKNFSRPFRSGGHSRHRSSSDGDRYSGPRDRDRGSGGAGSDRPRRFGSGSSVGGVRKKRPFRPKKSRH